MLFPLLSPINSTTRRRRSSTNGDQPIDWMSDTHTVAKYISRFLFIPLTRLVEMYIIRNCIGFNARANRLPERERAFASRAIVCVCGLVVCCFCCKMRAATASPAQKKVMVGLTESERKMNVTRVCNCYSPSSPSSPFRSPHAPVRAFRPLPRRNQTLRNAKSHQMNANESK